MVSESTQLNLIKSKRKEIKNIEKNIRIPRVTIAKQFQLQSEFGDTVRGAKEFRRVSKIRRQEGLGQISILNSEIASLETQLNTPIIDIGL
jgi:hypothetical protein